MIIFDHMRTGASANDSSKAATPLTIPLMARSSADLIKALRVRGAPPVDHLPPLALRGRVLHAPCRVLAAATGAGSSLLRQRRH